MNLMLNVEKICPKQWLTASKVHFLSKILGTIKLLTFQKIFDKNINLDNFTAIKILEGALLTSLNCKAASGNSWIYGQIKKQATF